MTPAVFLDRDGTLVEEAGYLDRFERVALYPWSIDAVRLLNRAGFLAVVLTNQAGIARGIVDEGFVQELHRFLADRFTAGGARLDAFYYCPHHHEAPLERYRVRCECRKPRAGMVRQAERDLGVDVARSFVIGDRWIDVELARACGARGILVRTGYGRSEETRPRTGLAAAAVADNLMAAAAWVIRDVRRRT